MKSEDYLRFNIESVKWAQNILKKFDVKFPRDGDLYVDLSTEFGWLLIMLDYTASPRYFYEQQIEHSKTIVLKKIGDYSWAQIIDDNLLRVYPDKKEVTEIILQNFPQLPPPYS